MDVKTVAVRLKAEHADYVKGMKASGDSSAQFGKLATGALLAVGTAAAAFALKSADAYVSYGKTMMGLARISGENIETASKWAFAAQQSGVSAETLSNGIKFLEKNMASGNEQFAKLGVSVTDSNGKFRSSHEVFLDTADAISKLGKGTEQTDAILKIFGRSGLALGAMLSKGRAGIVELENEAQKYGLVLTADNLPAIQANIKAHRQLDAAMQGAQIQLGQQVLPTLTSAIEVFAKLPAPIASSIAPIGGLAVGMIGLQKITSLLGVSMGPAGLALAAFGASAVLVKQNIEESNKAVASMKGTVDDTFGKAGTFADAERITNKTAEAAKSLREEAGGILNPLDIDYIESLKSGAAELENTTIVQRILNEQVKAYAAVNHVSIEEAYRAVQAEREGTKAKKEAGNETELTTEKIKAMTDAVTGLNNAERAAFDPQFAMTDSMNKLSEATQKVTDAEWAVVAAQIERNNAVAIWGPTSAQAIDAELKLTAAKNGQTTAANDLARANIDVDVAVRNLTNAYATNQTSIEDTRETLNNWVASGRLTQDQANRIAWSLLAAKIQADKLNGTQVAVTATVYVNDSALTTWLKSGAAQVRIGVPYKAPDGKTYVETGTGTVEVPARADGGPVRGGGEYLVGERGPELFRPNVAGSIVANGKWGAWGAGQQVYEDGSWKGMPEWAKRALDFAQSVQKQDAMRAHPELQGKPGWGALEADPFAGWKAGAFAGWDPKADFSQWGKAVAMGPSAGSASSSRSDGSTTITNNVTIQAPLGVDVDSTVRLIHSKLRDLENSRN